MLSDDEINALLQGVNMGYGRSIVITAYGHDDVIDKIAVSAFEGSSNYYRNDEDAKTYIEMINALELKEKNWVHARIAPENTPLSLKLFLPIDFAKIILEIDGKALQKVFREVDNRDLAMALKGSSEAVMEKAFKNMSSRASVTMKEDIECMGPVRINNIEGAQQKIISVIKHLEDTGEIVILKGNGEGIYL